MTAPPHEALKLARRMRLDMIRNRIPNDHWRLARLADERFGLPVCELPFWERSASGRPWRNQTTPGDQA